MIVVPKRHWRSYGNDPLPSGAEALDEPLNAFPSWFLQVTCDDREDLPVPGQKYTFGVVKAAQARGDFQVLADRKRRALRVHLGADVKAGLTKLADLVKEILT